MKFEMVNTQVSTNSIISTEFVLSGMLCVWCILIAIIFIKMRKNIKKLSEDKVSRMLRNRFIIFWIMFILTITIPSMSYHTCPTIVDVTYNEDGVVTYEESLKSNSLLEDFFEKLVVFIVIVAIIMPFIFLIANVFVKNRVSKESWNYFIYIMNYFLFFVTLIISVADICSLMTHSH